jgi:1-deoxy-D-xylulose-5-phosphate reductoisomerase
MGPKISVDSATLVNKALELIEAHHLFEVPPEQLSVVIHPQSLVHSMVEWQDGHWIAQLAPNDMVHPIAYALAYPERWATPFPRLEPERLGQLEFLPVDPNRYPAFFLGRSALRTGGSAPAVFNAANEVAVQAFLAGRIPFPAIAAILEWTLERHAVFQITSLEEALEADRWGREQADRWLSERASIR